MEPLTISVKATVAALGLQRTTVFKLIREGQLRVTRVGRRTLVHTQSIRDLLNRDGDLR